MIVLSMPVEAIALACALTLDLSFGEWPNRIHPVALLGRLVGWLTRRAPREGKALPFAFGASLTALLTAFGVAAAWGVERVCTELGPLGGLALGLSLKPTFALRALGEAGMRMHAALVEGGAPQGRPLLSHLCSRDPGRLGDRELSAATVESLAENLSDSVVAPLLAFVAFGLPGAVAFRIINTLDAMLGYRDHREWLGKAPARLDDLLGLVPSRLTAFYLLLMGALMGRPPVRAFRIALRDARSTESPNAGWPMATVAGLLETRLEKEGAYVLGAELPSPEPSTIPAASSLVRGAAFLAVASMLLALSFDGRLFGG